MVLWPVGSDPAKWLVLMRYWIKKRVFLSLEFTFWGSKVGFKGFGVLGSGYWIVCFLDWVWVVFTAAVPP